MNPEKKGMASAVAPEARSPAPLDEIGEAAGQAVAGIRSIFAEISGLDAEVKAISRRGLFKIGGSALAVAGAVATVDVATTPAVAGLVGKQIHQQNSKETPLREMPGLRVMNHPDAELFALVKKFHRALGEETACRVAIEKYEANPRRPDTVSLVGGPKEIWWAAELKRRAFDKRYGWSKLLDRHEAAHKREIAAGRLVLSTPAHTKAGIQAKVEVGSLSHQSGAAVQILGDMVRVMGGAS